MPDDEINFFDQTPVRNEVYEDYDPGADPDKVVKQINNTFDQSAEDLKEKIKEPMSEEDVKKIGLPSTAMGEEPPEDIDKEEWEGAKEKPDDRLHNLWRAYRYGTEHTEPGDPRVKGKIPGELNGMIYEAVHMTGGGPPRGELERKGRNKVLKAAEQYDPRYNTELSTYAGGKLFQGGGTTLSNVNRKLGDPVNIADSRYQHVTEYKDFIEEFKNKNGREPSNAEIADNISALSVTDVKKMRREAAQATDATQMLDEDRDATGQSYTKDAVKAVYYDSNPKEQRAMEYMFPDYLDGEEPPVPIDAGGMSWIGDQIDKSSSGMSKLKSKIKGRIEDLM